LYIKKWQIGPLGNNIFTSIKGFNKKEKKAHNFPSPLVKALNSTYLKNILKKEIREYPMGGSPS
jgi:hypothetical protein